MAETPVCTIDATGIHKPDFGTVLEYYKTQYRGIYGSDVYLENDSQDGQMLSLLALALDKVNSACVAAYNAFSPSTAQGVGLSSNVKINGISRKVASYSTVDLSLVGQAGTVITAGIASDTNNNQWNLPPVVVIPLSGTIIVSATAANLGAINAEAGSITTIATPTRGWQAVTNPSPATPGAPIEEDGLLRLRQSESTMNPSQNILNGIVGGILALPDVLGIRPYENEGDAVDANGIPGHSTALIVEGGDANSIAMSIFVRKGTGSKFYGTTTVQITDVFGIPHDISFYRPTLVPITYNLTVRALKGFTAEIQSRVQQALSDWTNALGVGSSLLLNRANVPLNLSGDPESQTYEIQALTVARNGGAFSTADIAIAFNEKSTCAPTSINVTVVV